MGKIVSLESLRGKREQLRAKVDATRAELDAMLAELVEIEHAEKIVMRYGVDDGEVALHRPASREERLPLDEAGPSDEPSKPMTKRQLFITILAQSASPWMTANEIQAKARAMTGKPYPMKSVSPMLSDMKNSGDILRDDLRVALKSRIERETPAG
jgi:hypothetical protein